MTRIAFTEQVEMFTLHCAACGILFAVTRDFEERRRKDHGTFHCPSGHGNSFRADSEADKLRRENENLKQQQARLQQEANDACGRAAAEADRRQKAEREVKRINKRISHGVCPDCNRSFANVAKHMASKHHKPVLKCVE